jgi:hypothetical protein
VLGGVGAAALVTGAVLLLWPEAPERSGTRISGAVYPTAGGAALGLGLRF